MSGVSSSFLATFYDLAGKERTLLETRDSSSNRQNGQVVDKVNDG